MSYQCKNCEREKDQNNNYVNASYAANANGTRGNSRGSAAAIRTRSGSDQQQKRLTSSINDHTSSGVAQGGTQGSGSGGSATTTQVTAKVMWGSVGAIKELREKEQAERNQVTRAGRRQ